MQDIFSTLQELAVNVRSAREAAGLSVVALAAQSGRARTLVHRLEGGGDVTVSALLDLLRALNLGLRLEPLAPPTLDQVRLRFADLDEDTGGSGSPHG